jgi:hypothetical protein
MSFLSFYKLGELKRRMNSDWYQREEEDVGKGYRRMNMV